MYRQTGQDRVNPWHVCCSWSTPLPQECMTVYSRHCWIKAFWVTYQWLGSKVLIHLPRKEVSTAFSLFLLPSADQFCLTVYCSLNPLLLSSSSTVTVVAPFVLLFTPFVSIPPSIFTFLISLLGWAAKPHSTNYVVCGGQWAAGDPGPVNPVVELEQWRHDPCMLRCGFSVCECMCECVWPLKKSPG